jgi:hypothetical protein
VQKKFSSEDLRVGDHLEYLNINTWDHNIQVDLEGIVLWVVNSIYAVEPLLNYQ